MEQFKNTEQKAIFEKLKNNGIDAMGVFQGSGYQTKAAADIAASIDILERTKDNRAYRPLISNVKILGKAIVFIKKVIRILLLQWYVEPVCTQQTVFNNAATSAIAGINAKLNTISEIPGRNEERILKLEEQLEELKNIQVISNQTLIDHNNKFEALDKRDTALFNPKSDNFWDKRSVAQAGEDTIAAYIAMALQIPMQECTYLDLGANHAKDLSNTYYFYEKGAHGVLVEANPALIPELKFYRPHDIILNNCIDTVSGKTVDFYVLNGDGLSTPDYDAAQEFIQKNPSLKIEKTVSIETISVNEIIERYLVKAPVILNIDIEGKDMEILGSIDFEKYRPLIIITEMIPYKPQLVIGDKNTQIMDFMTSINYVEYAFTGINSIFVDKNRIQEVIR